MADRKSSKMSRFTGMNNVLPLEELASTELRSIVNAFVTDRGRLVRRDGYSEVVAGSTHSLGGNEALAACVQGGTLYSIDAGYGLTQVRTDMSPDARVMYLERGNDVYYSNSQQHGVLKADGTHQDYWAVPTPTHNPDLSATAEGGLLPGRYKVAVTHVDDTGRESGALLSTYVDLLQQGGIQIDRIPSSAHGTNVYMSSANGETLFWQMRLLAGTTSATVYNMNPGMELQTQFLSPIPAGTHMTVHKGRMYSADGSVIWYEEAFRRGLTRLSTNFVPFPGTVTMCESVADGIFVSADMMYFLRGTGPGDFVLEEIGPSKVVLGTAIRVPASKFEDGELNGDIVMWVSNDGVIAGLPDGTLKNLTENKVSFPVGESGAGMFRQEEGATQYVTSLEKPHDEEHVYAMQDKVVAEVYRNGVLVN